MKNKGTHIARDVRVVQAARRIFTLSKAVRTVTLIVTAALLGVDLLKYIGKRA